MKEKTMKEKGLIKHVVYSPNEYLKIEGKQNKSVKWQRAIAFFVFVFFAVTAKSLSDFLPFLFFVFIFTLIFSNIFEFNSHYIEFSKQKVIVRENSANKEQEQSFYLKQPLYLDITIKPRKELLLLTFEQFGETIGTAALPPDELPYLLDSLSDLLELEIHETRSTNKREDVLYLRPIGSSEDLLPSYLKITENPMRLIVNPVENHQNFIVNYQRKILKTATGNIYSLDDIHTISLVLDTRKISIEGVLSSNSIAFTIIEFQVKGYGSEVIKKDLQNLADFLKAIPVLSSINFHVLYRHF